MILLNNEPLKVECYGEVYNLNFFATRYMDDSLAIVCETDIGEPWDTVSVNLSGYDMKPHDGCIFLSHDLSRDLRKLFTDNFVDVEHGANTVYYGFASSLEVKLKDEILEKIKEEE